MDTFTIITLPISYLRDDMGSERPELDIPFVVLVGNKERLL